jgi:hypothetical protein
VALDTWLTNVLVATQEYRNTQKRMSRHDASFSTQGSVFVLECLRAFLTNNVEEIDRIPIQDDSTVHLSLRKYHSVDRVPANRSLYTTKGSTEDVKNPWTPLSDDVITEGGLPMSPSKGSSNNSKSSAVRHNEDNNKEKGNQKKQESPPRRTPVQESPSRRTPATISTSSASMPSAVEKSPPKAFNATSSVRHKIALIEKTASSHTQTQVLPRAKEEKIVASTAESSLIHRNGGGNNSDKNRPKSHRQLQSMDVDSAPAIAHVTTSASSSVATSLRGKSSSNATSNVSLHRKPQKQSDSQGARTSSKDVHDSSAEQKVTEKAQRGLEALGLTRETSVMLLRYMDKFVAKAMIRQPGCYRITADNRLAIDAERLAIELEEALFDLAEMTRVLQDPTSAEWRPLCAFEGTL